MDKWARAKYLPGIPLGEDGRRVTSGRKNIEISKNAAREGMVLLKNDGGTLPIDEGSKIALFGKATIDYVKGGGGSGDVTVAYTRNLYDGFCQIMDSGLIFPDTVTYYDEYVNALYAEGVRPGLVAEPELSEEMVKKAADFADIAIISFSRYSGEGWDRMTDDYPEVLKSVREKTSSVSVHMADAVFDRADFYFTEAEKRVTELVKRYFSKVVVVLNTGGMMETGCLADDPGIGAVLLAWQAGMEGGLVEAEALMGVFNPSGKLSDTFAGSLSDYPFAEDFHQSLYHVNYYEDIYVGYRYFETVPGAADKVVYPFGYGLSYTTFELGKPVITVTGPDASCDLKDAAGAYEDLKVTVKVSVKNTGSRAGREVVQVYYGAPQGKLGKPAKELAGYKKTKTLEPGETCEVYISFPVSQMASYDDLGKVAKSAWVLEAGSYKFYVGTDVRSAALSDFTYEISEDKVTCQLNPRMTPTKLEKRMLSDGTFEALPSYKYEPYDVSAEKPGVYENHPAESIFEPKEESELRGYDLMKRPEARYVKKEAHPRLKDVADEKMTLDEFISRMTDEDLAHLLGGQQNTGIADTGGFGNNEALGIPNFMTADGPAGLRIIKDRGVVTTAFPSATLLACTWDPAVTYAVGAAAAREVKENNIYIWLAPAVNIHRNPLCGRNFEYYSEDPLLTGKQAAALVRGVQSQKVAATPKHFALNNKETERKHSDSRASERAIREIYLKQFEIIVKEGHPWCLMSSYNLINGTYTSENADLLIHILREEWGFDGVVTTDWITMPEHYNEVIAGNDMRMPHGYPDRILEARRRGEISREAMETAARHILTLFLRLE